MRISLEDLPPRYRAQAEAQIAGRKNKKTPAEQSLAEAATAAGKLGKAFGSRGEYEFYIGKIVPGIQAGRICRATPQVRFDLLPAKEFCGLKLPAAHYTCDYMIEYADGVVEVVEIKSKFTRRAQRDYIYRRRLFIDLIAEPKGWRFREIVTDDTRESVKKWKELAGGQA
nr:MAG TPA: Endonuclease [Caudoviricetes sp.]